MSEADFTDDALQEDTAVGQEAPETPTEVPEPTTEEAEQSERLLAGKYKTPEELERAHHELESVLGQQGSELAQLRQAVQALNEPEYQPADAPLPTDETMDAIVEIIEEGRMTWPQVVQWAGTQSPHLYEQVMDSWHENEPRQQTRYENAQMLEQRHQQLAHEVSPYIQQQQEQQTADRVLDTWRTMATRHEDFNQVGAHISEAIGQNPELAAAAANPDPQIRERAFETLYVLAKHQAESAPQAPQQPQAPPVNAAKAAAQVASASSAQTRGDTGHQAQVSAYLDRLVGGGLSVESGLERP